MRIFSIKLTMPPGYSATVSQETVSTHKGPGTTLPNFKCASIFAPSNHLHPPVPHKAYRRTAGCSAEKYRGEQYRVVRRLPITLKISQDSRFHNNRNGEKVAPTQYSRADNIPILPLSLDLSMVGLPILCDSPTVFLAVGFHRGQTCQRAVILHGLQKLSQEHLKFQRIELVIIVGIACRP